MSVDMEYTKLGSTGMDVSRLCLGCASFGSGEVVGGEWEWTIDDTSQGLAVIDRAIDAGINFLDTANIYSTGDSERIVGEAIEGRRDELVLASKVGGRMREGPNGAGLSRKHVLEQARRSLDRLGTDYLDLYYSHSWDDETPIAETLSAFDHLLNRGTVNYLGASNLASWQLMKALWTSDRRGYEPYACVQSEYSLIARQEEGETLPVAADQGLGVTTYSPIGGGFLAGLYDRDEEPEPGSRLAHEGREWGSEALWEVFDRASDVADEKGATPVQVGVAWVLAKDVVDSVIIGPETVEQLEEYLGALSVDLDDEEMAHLEEPLDGQAA